MSELVKRLLTALILIAIVVTSVVYLPKLAFLALLYVFISVAAVEWVKLYSPHAFSKTIMFMGGAAIGSTFLYEQIDLSLVLFLCILISGIFLLFTIKSDKQVETFPRNFSAYVVVFFYIYLTLFFLAKIRFLSIELLFFLILVIAIGDSGAFFIGKKWGSHKIYPYASPNKTVEGFLAAIFFAGLSGYLAWFFFSGIHAVPPFTVTLTAGAMGMLSQISDPVESLFKRAAGKKDSGNLLPGHGGMLDRMDSYMFCAPAFYFIVYYIWN